MVNRLPGPTNRKPVGAAICRPLAFETECRYETLNFERNAGGRLPPPCKSSHNFLHYSVLEDVLNVDKLAWGRGVSRTRIFHY